jgi:hypothetical protein
MDSTEKLPIVFDYLIDKRDPKSWTELKIDILIQYIYEELDPGKQLPMAFLEYLTRVSSKASELSEDHPLKKPMTELAERLRGGANASKEAARVPSPASASDTARSSGTAFYDLFRRTQDPGTQVPTLAA